MPGRDAVSGSEPPITIGALLGDETFSGDVGALDLGGGRFVGFRLATERGAGPVLPSRRAVRRLSATARDAGRRSRTFSHHVRMPVSTVYLDDHESMRRRAFKDNASCAT